MIGGGKVGGARATSFRHAGPPCGWGPNSPSSSLAALLANSAKLRSLLHRHRVRATLQAPPFFSRSPMLQKAYIHTYGNHAVEPEHQGVREVLTAQGIPCELFTDKKLHRNQLALDGHTLVVGDHPTMLRVFRQLGIAWAQDSYPPGLRQYLRRPVWETSIRALLAESEEKDLSGLFVKPKSSTKLFTGFVLSSATDVYRLQHFAGNTALYCSPVVHWLAEYRVFVINAQVVGIKQYAGGAALPPDMAVVEQAIRDFAQSPEHTAAYGIDFGILADGATALVEWNDGFALGSYGLDPAIYTELILTRWRELLASRTQASGLGQ